MQKTKGNVLFVAQFPIDSFRGGVQKVTSILAEEMKRQGYGISFLSLASQTDRDPVNETQYYLPVAGTYTNAENIRFAKDLIQTKQINYVINQAGIYTYVSEFFETIGKEEYRLFTVYHNCLICLNKRYREIRLSNPGALSGILRRVDFSFIWSILKELNRRKTGQMFKRALSQVDKLVLLSPVFIPELTFFGVKERSLDKVAGIFNPSPYKPMKGVLEKKEKRIAFVGRLEIAQKRVDWLMEIWLRIHRKYPEWEFDVVGDGSARGFMEEFANKNDMKGIRFHGYADPTPVLEKASIFTLTSDFEGWGMVLAEAMAYGTVPVVYNSFAALKDLVKDEETGLYVQAFDMNQYVEKVEQLVLDPEKRRTMAETGQKSLDRFMPEMVVRDWEALFNS